VLVQEIDSVEYGLTDIQVWLETTVSVPASLCALMCDCSLRLLQEIHSVEYGLTDIQVRLVVTLVSIDILCNCISVYRQFGYVAVSAWCRR
jgi:hypothetical protein